MNLQDWYEEKRKAIEATGWRRHGGKVGDKVRLCAREDWYEDELYEFIEGKERNIDLRIKDGATGEIVEILEGDRVKATFQATIGYWRKSLRHEFTDAQILELCIVSADEVKHYDTLFDPVLTLIKPTAQPVVKQLSLFD